MTKHPIRLLVSREHAQRILMWYTVFEGELNPTNEDAALAASIEQAIESHDEEMERQAAYAERKKANKTDPALTTAARHTRMLFGGKL
jgi:hypothetical protein